MDGFGAGARELRHAGVRRDNASFEKAPVSRLLLVDGHGYAYRAFHAIGGLRAPDGRPTNAIFGFIKMFEKARTLVGPTHVAVVWDGGLDDERVESLPDYKGQRPEMPDDLEVQLDEIDAYLAAAGVFSVCQEGVEADDLIATLAAKASREGWSVVIATSDKDFMQLVSAEVQMLNPGDKTQQLWGESQVMEKTGVRPAQVVDWLSLVGDRVDNINGVPGVGPKTAAKLLTQFGSIDGIYRELDTVQPERLKTALAEARAPVLRNRSLVALKLGLRGAPGTGECLLGVEDRNRLRGLCETWGFGSMVKAYGGHEHGQEQLL